MRKVLREIKPSQTRRDSNISISIDVESAPCSELNSIQPEENEDEMLLELATIVNQQLAFPAGQYTGSTDLTATLQKIIDQQSRSGTRRSTYDVIWRRFRWLASRGFSFMLVDQHPRVFHSGERAKQGRSIMTTVSMSFLDYRFRDFLNNDEAGCPLAEAWPLAWSIFSNYNNGMALHVMALPVKETGEGSFMALKLERLSWTTLGKANELFFKLNGWEFNEFQDIYDNGNITLFELQVPEEQYNCTADYFFEECQNFSVTAVDDLCSEWGHRCQIDVLIPLADTKTGYTHVIYLPNKNRGWNSTAANERSYFSFEKASYSSVVLAEDTAERTASLLQSSEENYLPKLEKNQDVLTFVIVVLVWFSEWMLSISFIIDRLWRRLFKKWLGTSASVQDYAAEKDILSKYRQIKRKIKESWVLTLPAITGFVPLVIGLVQARRRKYAEVGVLVAAWSSEIYETLGNPLLDIHGLSNGHYYSFSVRYEERSSFQSLLTHYAVSASIASVLMALSIGILLIHGLILWRRRPTDEKLKILADSNYPD